MSDAALDRQYEESLQRCRAEGHPRLFFFRVDTIEVGVCPRCNQRFVADPMQGDSSEWDQAAREGAEHHSEMAAWGTGIPAGGGPAEGATTASDPVPPSAGSVESSIADHPAGGRSNICAHCRPRVFPGPSGVHMRHELSCSEKPGQRIDAKDYAGLMPQGSEPWRKGRRW